MHHVTGITAKHVERLFRAMNEALNTTDYFIRENYENIALSFDQDLFAYFASKDGYIPKEERIYLEDYLFIINKVKPFAKVIWRSNPRKRYIGKFYLRKEGAMYSAKLGHISLLCTWSWPC